MSIIWLLLLVFMCIKQEYIQDHFHTIIAILYIQYALN